MFWSTQRSALGFGTVNINKADKQGTTETIPVQSWVPARYQRTSIVRNAAPTIGARPKLVAVGAGDAKTQASGRISELSALNHDRRPCYAVNNNT